MFPGVDQGRLISIARATTAVQVSRLHLEVDLAAAHARDVKQVVNQSGQLLDLTLDRSLAP